MEALHSIPWRLVALAAALILLVTFSLTLLPYTRAGVVKWLRRRSGGAMVYVTLGTLILSSVWSDRTAPLPQFGREHELEQALKAASTQIAALKTEKSLLSQERAQISKVLEERSQSLRQVQDELVTLAKQNAQLANQVIAPTERELALDNRIRELEAELTRQRQHQLDVAEMQPLSVIARLVDMPGLTSG